MKASLDETKIILFLTVIVRAIAIIKMHHLRLSFFLIIIFLIIIFLIIIFLIIIFLNIIILSKGKSMVFYHTRGVSEGNKKPNCFFGTLFFQRACRIIIGPPKHVLHLVWSAYIISTAIISAPLTICGYPTFP